MFASVVRPNALFSDKTIPSPGIQINTSTANGVNRYEFIGLCDYELNATQIARDFKPAPKMDVVDFGFTYTWSSPANRMYNLSLDLIRLNLIPQDQTDHTVQYFM